MILKVTADICCLSYRCNEYTSLGRTLEVRHGNRFVQALDSFNFSWVCNSLALGVNENCRFPLPSQ